MAFSKQGISSGEASEKNLVQERLISDRGVDHSNLLHGQILLNMSEGINLVCKDNGKIVYSNPAFDRMFGYQHAEIIGLHISMLYHANGQGTDNPALSIMEELNNYGFWQGEIESVKKDGSAFWSSVRINSFEHPDHGEAWISVISDITQRKKAEHFLREKELQFRYVIDASPVPYALNDDAGNITYLNPAFINTFGYTRKDIPNLAHWWPKAYPDESYRQWVAEIWKRRLDHSKSEGVPFEPVELLIRCKDGSNRSAMCSVAPLADRYENSHLVILYDITDRKKYENDLLIVHNELTRTQFAMDNVGVGIHIVEVDGRFSYVNQAAADLLGYSRSEMMSMSVSDIDPNFPQENFMEITAPLRELSGVDRIETTQKCKDGRLIPVEVTFHYMPDANAEYGRFMSFIVDLTEKRQAQEIEENLQKQLFQAQKMVSIGHLTGGIAHDFNNILAVVLGNTEMLKMRASESNLDRQACDRYMDAILAAGNRAKELVSQLLVYSRGIEKKKNLRDNPVVELVPVIQEAMGLLRSSLPASIELAFTAEDKTLKAMVKPIHLHQIIMNLCINARDAIGQYGSIHITIHQRSVTGVCTSCHERYHGNYIVLVIEDSGPGVDDALLDRMFEPFFTTKSVGAGTGMGLSVVHGLIHSAGGHIEVKNNSGQGACFNILLPMLNEMTNEAQSMPAAAAMADMQHNFTGSEIMVIDDEPSITSLLESLLSMHGATVTGFTDPLEAMSYFESAHANIDLVITDQTMPGLTGLDLSQKLLARRPDLPIILCSGYSRDVSPDNEKLKGVVNYLLKPVVLSELLDIVQNSLHSQ